MTIAIADPNDYASMENARRLKDANKATNIWEGQQKSTVLSKVIGVFTKGGGIKKNEDVYIVAHGSAVGTSDFVKSVINQLKNGHTSRLVLLICGASDPRYLSGWSVRANMSSSLLRQTEYYLMEEQRTKTLNIEIVAYEHSVSVDEYGEIDEVPPYRRSRNTRPETENIELPNLPGMPF